MAAPIRFTVDWRTVVGLTFGMWGSWLLGGLAGAALFYGAAIVLTEVARAHAVATVERQRRPRRRTPASRLEFTVRRSASLCRPFPIE